MRFAVNYSYVLADLINEGLIKIDLFKCPAWPEVVRQAREILPAYVHMPVRTAANGIYDGERKQQVDWARIEQMLNMSDTPFVNVHLMASPKEYPHIPVESTLPTHQDQIIQDFSLSIQEVVSRYGKDRVIVENTPGGAGSNLTVAILPNVIRQIIEITDAGLLFDVSHARLAALELEIDAKAYIAELPTERTREIHLTGTGIMTRQMLDMLDEAGLAQSIFHRFEGRMIDHLPLRDEDWTFTAWAMEQVHLGNWGTPDLVTLEYGGVGGIWEFIGDRNTMTEQIPRLYNLVHNGATT